MQEITLLISIIGSLLVLFLRPVYALGMCFGLLLWYPNYLTVDIGTINISVGRIVVTILLLRCLCDNGIREKYSWSGFDKLVILSVVVYMGIYFISHEPLSDALENRGGFLIDTLFSYITVRMVLKDSKTVVSFIKMVALFLAPLAILGMVESISHHLYFYPLMRFITWEPNIIKDFEGEMRWGLTRAMGPFSHSIMFGCNFAMFLPLVYYLRCQKNSWHFWAYIFSVVLCIGIFSSMSSGPWMMGILTILCLVLKKFPYFMKPLLIGFGLLCVAIGIVSNRPFYHVLISFLNPIGGHGWYRARLVDIAIKNFGQWWLIGYGGKDPGWADEMGGGNWTDVTNEFVLVGVEYGILGVIVLISVLVVAFRGITSMYKQSTNQQSKSLYWSLGSVLFSVIIAWTSVSFFGQMRPLFYGVLGIIGSSLTFNDKTIQSNRKNLLIKPAVSIFSNNI